MAQQSQVRNPFMLMMQPEVVLAAIENSERLGQLNRRLCRPLDRHVAQVQPVPADLTADSDDADDDLDASH